MNKDLCIQGFDFFKINFTTFVEIVCTGLLSIMIKKIYIVKARTNQKTFEPKALFQQQKHYDS